MALFLFSVLLLFAVVSNPAGHRVTAATDTPAAEAVEKPHDAQEAVLDQTDER